MDCIFTDHRCAQVLGIESNLAPSRSCFSGLRVTALFSQFDEGRGNQSPFFTALTKYLKELVVRTDKYQFWPD